MVYLSANEGGHRLLPVFGARHIPLHGDLRSFSQMTSAFYAKPVPPSNPNGNLRNALRPDQLKTIVGLPTR